MTIGEEWCHWSVNFEAELSSSPHCPSNPWILSFNQHWWEILEYFSVVKYWLISVTLFPWIWFVCSDCYNALVLFGQLCSGTGLRTQLHHQQSKLKEHVTEIMSGPLDFIMKSYYWSMRWWTVKKNLMDFLNLNGEDGRTAGSGWNLRGLFVEAFTLWVLLVMLMNVIYYFLFSVQDFTCRILVVLKRSPYLTHWFYRWSLLFYMNLHVLKLNMKILCLSANIQILNNGCVNSFKMFLLMQTSVGHKSRVSGTTDGTFTWCRIHERVWSVWSKTGSNGKLGNDHESRFRWIWFTSYWQYEITSDVQWQLCSW